jgi:nucleotide-binding universal stress UspA family protein/CBS domain-containing protein
MATSVRDAMTENPRSIGASVSVVEAARLMREERIGSLPITEDEKLVGMITDRDIATKVVAEAADPQRTSVGDVYSRDLISVEADEDLEEALQLMARHQVRRLPVVENGRLVGIVAQADIALSENEQKTGVFERIVCGVDGSPQSLEAVRQSDLLLETGGRLLLAAVVDPMQAIHFQVAPTAAHVARRALHEIEELDEAAAHALERARAEVARAADVATQETGGQPAACLLDAASSERATLVAVGTHGLGRAAGIVLGSVATRVLHRARCSVLVARRAAAGEWTPRTIVVGVDGSTAADAALGGCRELEARFGSEVRVVTSEARRPAHALVQAAADANLLAVGSRSSHRVLGLGSVSEHVAHHARCSVLVVRSALPTATA